MAFRRKNETIAPQGVFRNVYSLMILNEKVFLNDSLVDSGAAQISIHDSGLLHGVG